MHRRIPTNALQDFLDGRLSGVAAEQVRAHLATCASCQAVRDELTTAREALATLRGDDIADAGRPARLGAAQPRGRGRDGAQPCADPHRRVNAGASEAATRRRRWFAVAAAAAVVVAYLALGNRATPLDLPAQAARDLGCGRVAHAAARAAHGATPLRSSDTSRQRLPARACGSSTWP